LDLTLTFDNGPEPETTRFVLDVLARRSIRTTFFVVGNKLSTSEGRDMARRAHEEARNALKAAGEAGLQTSAR
jgi:peptidoglycan/xylan/chitin deacetylase (PgdA/CDA1 family)